MSGYVRNIQISTEFDGQQVTVTLRPLKRADLFKLQGELPKDIQFVDGKAALSNADAAKVIDFYAARLAEYVIEANVVDAAGTPVPVKDWIESAYFTPLVADVMRQHMDKATPANP